MHIGLFTPDFPGSTYANGIITYVAVMKEALEAAGHRVSLISPAAVKDPEGEVRPIVLGGGVAAKLRRWVDGHRPTVGAGPGADRRMAELMRAARAMAGFDLLEIEESFGFAGTVAAALPCPVVMRLHGPYVFGREPVESDEAAIISERRILAEGKAMRSVAAITSPSTSLLEATLGHYRAKAPLARVIANPMRAAPEEALWRIEDCDPRHLLFVGRFDLRKGADVVLRAFALAAAKDPGLRLSMAGPDGGLAMPDGSRRRFAQFAAEELPAEVRGRIRFLGQLDAVGIAAARRETGIALVGARFETFSYVIAESLAMGKPVIATRTFAEIVEDGATGILVPREDAAAMAEAILALVANPARMAELGRNGWRYCRDELAPARIAAETIAFYEEAIRR